MTGIERNGMSGLALRAVVIALAAIMFGSVSKAPYAYSSTTASIAVAAR